MANSYRIDQNKLLLKANEKCVVEKLSWGKFVFEKNYSCILSFGYGFSFFIMFCHVEKKEARILEDT